MTKVLKLFIILILTVLCSCSQQESVEEQKLQLENNVIGVHDSAMLKMNRIYLLRRDLRALRDSLEVEKVDTLKVIPLMESIQKLNEADEAMMNWMRQYKTPANLTHDQAIDYLKNELVKIERVEALMDSNISVAQQIYETHTYSDQQ
jgi:hypothetical protein